MDRRLQTAEPRSVFALTCVVSRRQARVVQGQRLSVPRTFIVPAVRTVLTPGDLVEAFSFETAGGGNRQQGFVFLVGGNDCQVFERSPGSLTLVVRPLRLQFTRRG